MSVLSAEYVLCPVQAIEAGVAYDPTGDVVQFAFQPVGTSPSAEDWYDGSWQSGSLNNLYTAQILVGPVSAGIGLSAGLYAVWLKITDNPEVPVRQVGALTITP